MTRVFLDATVLYSAADSPNGLNRAIFKVAEKLDNTVLLANWYVRDEADINLMERGLEQAREELKTLVTNHLENCRMPPRELIEQVKSYVPADPADAPVLASAIAAEADWLVTGNRTHFEHLYGTRVEGVLVLRPRQAFDYLTLAANSSSDTDDTSHGTSS